MRNLLQFSKELMHTSFELVQRCAQLKTNAAAHFESISDCVSMKSGRAPKTLIKSEFPVLSLL